MDNIKITVTIELPGRRIYKDNETKTEKGVLDLNKVEKHNYKYFDPKRKTSEVISYYTNKCVPAKQSINLSYEAYRGIVEAGPVTGYSGKWKNMTKEERIAAHLEVLAKAMGGTLLNFHVFDD